MSFGTRALSTTNTGLTRGTFYKDTGTRHILETIEHRPPAQRADCLLHSSSTDRRLGEKAPCRGRPDALFQVVAASMWRPKEEAVSGRLARRAGPQGLERARSTICRRTARRKARSSVICCARLATIGSCWAMASAGNDIINTPLTEMPNGSTTIVSDGRSPGDSGVSKLQRILVPPRCGRSHGWPSWKVG